MNVFSKKSVTVTFVFVIITLGIPAAAQAQSTQTLPGGVDLLWEADTYTPPFYKGKALFAEGGSLRVVAFPDESLGSPDSLFYTWKVDGVVLGSLSGQGKTLFTVPPSRFGRRQQVVVEVRSSQGGDILAASAFVANPTEPQIHLYERSPLRGVVFGRSLDPAFNVINDELVVEIYPYFFDTPQKNTLDYKTELNRDRIGSGDRVVLRKGEKNGSAIISSSVTNPLNVLQQASVQGRLEF